MYRTNGFPLSLPPLLLQNGPNWLLIRWLWDLIYNVRLTRRYHVGSSCSCSCSSFSSAHVTSRRRLYGSIVTTWRGHGIVRQRITSNSPSFVGLWRSPRSFVVLRNVVLCQHSWRVLRSLEFWVAEHASCQRVITSVLRIVRYCRRQNKTHVNSTCVRR